MNNLFKKYPSLEQAYNPSFIQKVNSNYGDLRYIVCEKIHGANVQIIYDPETDSFSYAKRTSIIGKDENFYNYQNVLGSYNERVKQLFNMFTKDITKKVKSFTLFGELYGGCYPHKEVDVLQNATKVQQGVYYTNSNEFITFDLFVRYEDESSEWVPYVKLLPMLSECSIPYPFVYGITNNFKDALEIPNDIETEMYKRFNLPKIENNIIEGTVIRPYEKELYFGETRLIIKNKNSKFLEKQKTKLPKVDVQYAKMTMECIEKISEYITEARIYNVISHYGEVSMKDMGMLIKETVNDIIEEFQKETGLYNKLEKEERKHINKFLNGKVPNMIKKVIMKG